MYLCKDCRYCQPDKKEWSTPELALAYASCSHPQITERHPVTGDVLGPLCRDARAPSKPLRFQWAKCGPEAQLFTPDAQLAPSALFGK